MDFLMVYASKHESARVASSMQSKKKELEELGISIGFVNKSKRNYKKAMEKMDESWDLPRAVIIWKDDREVMEYVGRNYPWMETITLDLDGATGNFCITSNDKCLHKVKLCMMNGIIIQKYQGWLEKKTVYLVDKYKCTLTPTEMDKVDEIQGKKKGKIFFHTEDEAMQFLAKKLKDDLDCLEEKIKIHRTIISNTNNEIKEKILLLNQKFQKYI